MSRATTLWLCVYALGVIWAWFAVDKVIWPVLMKLHGWG